MPTYNKPGFSSDSAIAPAAHDFFSGFDDSAMLPLIICQLSPRSLDLITWFAPWYNVYESCGEIK